MESIIPVIVPLVLESTNTKVAAQDPKEAAKEFDLDSENEDDPDMFLDLEGVDEQVSAIHCLGNLSLNCSALMQPYLEGIVAKL